MISFVNSAPWGFCLVFLVNDIADHCKLVMTLSVQMITCGNSALIWYITVCPTTSHYVPLCPTMSHYVPLHIFPQSFPIIFPLIAGDTSILVRWTLQLLLVKPRYNLCRLVKPPYFAWSLSFFTPSHIYHISPKFHVVADKLMFQ
jgi:hypothetical protein